MESPSTTSDLFSKDQSYLLALCSYYQEYLGRFRTHLLRRCDPAIDPQEIEAEYDEVIHCRTNLQRSALAASTILRNLGEFELARQVDTSLIHINAIEELEKYLNYTKLVGFLMDKVYERRKPSELRGSRSQEFATAPTANGQRKAGKKTTTEKNKGGRPKVEEDRIEMKETIKSIEKLYKKGMKARAISDQLHEQYTFVCSTIGNYRKRLAYKPKTH